MGYSFTSKPETDADEKVGDAGILAACAGVIGAAAEAPTLLDADIRGKFANKLVAQPHADLDLLRLGEQARVVDLRLQALALRRVARLQGVSDARCDGAQLTADGRQMWARRLNAWQRWAVKGLCVSGLNPKVFLLFLALLPQFTDATAPWPVPLLRR